MSQNDNNLNIVTMVENIVTIENINNVENCPVCLDIISDKNNIITNCGHKYCLTCIISLSIHKDRNTAQNNLLKCPMCVQNIKYITFNPQLIYDCINKYNNKTDDIENNKEDTKKFFFFYIKFLVVLITTTIIVYIIITAKRKTEFTDILFSVIISFFWLFFIILYILLLKGKINITT